MGKFWEVLNLGGIEKEREKRAEHVLIWFAEVPCLSDTPHAKKFTLGGREEKQERD